MTDFIEVEIPAPSWHEILFSAKDRGISTIDWIEGHTQAVIADVTFKGQPHITYKNIVAENGCIYITLDPTTLPDYYAIKGRYAEITTAVLELVAEHFVGEEAVNKGDYYNEDDYGERKQGGDINFDIFVLTPKAEWSAELITAYLWALIRERKSGVDSIPLTKEDVVGGFLARSTDVGLAAVNQLEDSQAASLASKYINPTELEDFIAGRMRAVVIDAAFDKHDSADESLARIQESAHQLSADLMVKIGNSLS